MRKKVLIVDDNLFVRRALRELFQVEKDFEVSGIAGNGKEAIAEAHRVHPDLVILDLSMPVMDGLDAARVLKREMPSIALIMYRSFGDSASEQQAQIIGISEVVSKSDDISVLIGKSRDVVQRAA